jgi:hypothetical protein
LDPFHFDSQWRAEQLVRFVNHHGIQELRGLKHTVGTGRSDRSTLIGSWLMAAAVGDSESVSSGVRADNLTLQKFSLLLEAIMRRCVVKSEPVPSPQVLWLEKQQ